MNEENFDNNVNYENQENDLNTFTPNDYSDDIIIPGNIIEMDDNVDNGGPIIMNQENTEQLEDEEILGPVIMDDESNEEVKEEKQEVVEYSTESFKQIEEELLSLKQEKIEIEKNIQELNKRCSELDVLIKSKQEELDYKKEVEVTTDKLKTYIRDLEVKPGAVRDALAALINNMNN